MGIRASRGNKETKTLRWIEGDYAGAVVVCRAEGSIGLARLFTRTAESLEERYVRFERFGKEVLLSWNLDDDDDEPFPANGEGMNAIPPSLAWEIVERWIDTAPDQTLGDIPADLDSATKSGDTSKTQNSSPQKSRTRS